METHIKIARAFYGIGMMAIGVFQFFYGDFRTVILPPWPEWRTGSPEILAYVSGVGFLTAGIAITLSIKGKEVALTLGGVFLAVLIFWHLPYILFIQPHQIRHLGIWAEASKALAMCGGAFVVAGSFIKEKTDSSKLISIQEKLIPLGPIFFSITMIEFGIDHFLYADGISTLVPAWMPGPIFCTYLAGALLVGSGIAVIFKIKLKLVAMLQGIMIFIWLLILHIPRAIADPYSVNGNEVLSSFDALAFSGIAFIIAFMEDYKNEKLNP